MADRIYAVQNDVGRVIGAVLKDDGTARNLTTADAIECHLANRSSGVVVDITGLTGNASGQVATALPTISTVGQYTLEWQVTEGSTVTTYPGIASNRPVLIVRAEAS